jgi:predicted transcriptional regulator
MKDIIFKTKQLKILLTLRDKSRDWYISDLAKTSNTTYVHTCNFIIACEAAGITSSEKHGKIKVVRLTEKGAQIAESLSAASALISKELAQAVAPQQPTEQKKS